MTPPTNTRGGGGDPPHSQQPASGKRASGTKATEPGLRKLLSALEGVNRLRTKPHPYWLAFCPCHPDVGTKRSLHVEYKIGYDGSPKLLVFCKTCRRDIDLEDICIELGLEQQEVILGNHVYDREIGYQEPKGVAALPVPATVMEWTKALHANDERLRYLIKKRGLDSETLRRYRIGWNEEEGRYTLPVYGIDGDLLNVRRYKSGAATGKMKGLLGRGSQLYPSVPATRGIVLCEGEWDALVARRHGFHSVTSTAGINGWKPEWSALFAGRHVAIVYDCQDPSRAAALERAVDLTAAGAVVRVVDLGLPGDGEDVSDWFVKYRRTSSRLRALIVGTAVWK